MISFQTIVAATDLSENSLSAIYFARDIAKRFQAGMHVISVVPYPVQELLEQCQQDYRKPLDECEQKHFDKWESSLNDLKIPDAAADTVRVAIKGFTVDEICRYVDNNQADVLVVGTHGYTGFRHMMMGSVAETLVRKSPCPVLTIRSASAKEEIT